MIKVSNGNKKIGNDTLILNMNSATDCPSKELGLCTIEGNKCYALKSEKCYPQVLPYRREQAVYWTVTPAREIAEDLRNVLRRKRTPIRYIRFSEAGDFSRQRDVTKMKDIARRIPEVSFYGYTARRDLDFNEIPDNLAVNGSGFMVSNSFTAVHDVSESEIQCPGNCRECDLCKAANGLDIKVKYH